MEIGYRSYTDEDLSIHNVMDLTRLVTFKHQGRELKVENVAIDLETAKAAPIDNMPEVLPPRFIVYPNPIVRFYVDNKLSFEVATNYDVEVHLERNTESGEFSVTLPDEETIFHSKKLKRAFKEPLVA